MFQDSQHIYPCVFTCMVCGGGRSKLLQYSGAASNSCALRHKMMISHPGTLCIDSLHVSSTAIRSLRHTLNSVAQGSQSCDLLCYDPNTQHGQEETHCCLLPKIQTRALGHIINNSSGFPIQLIYYKNTTLQSETPLAKTFGFEMMVYHREPNGRLMNHYNYRKGGQLTRLSCFARRRHHGYRAQCT